MTPVYTFRIVASAPIHLLRHGLKRWNAALVPTRTCLRAHTAQQRFSPLLSTCCQRGGLQRNGVCFPTPSADSGTPLTCPVQPEDEGQGDVVPSHDAD